MTAYLGRPLDEGAAILLRYLSDPDRPKLYCRKIGGTWTTDPGWYRAGLPAAQQAGVLTTEYVTPVLRYWVPSAHGNQWLKRGGRWEIG